MPETKAKPVLSVVVPLLNEESNVSILVQTLRGHLERLNTAYEILLVDDGSSDQTWNMIVAATIDNPSVRGLSLTRNFGHQNALLAGLQSAAGDAIVTMDGDLQHPPEVISEMFAAWQEGIRLIETVRIDSADTSFFKRFTSRVFYRLFSFLSGMPFGQGRSDFRLMDRRVVQAMIKMRDASLFLRGMAQWMGFPARTIEFKANPRHSGETKYSFVRMIRFSMSAVLSFSLKPLRLGIWVGLVTALAAFAELIYILWQYSHGVTLPGWASTLTVISFMFGILFILIGILGSYLAGITEILKNRPRFLIQETAGYPDED